MIAPLLFATLIYISFRSEKILINVLIQKTYLVNVFRNYRILLSPALHYIPSFVYYSLPSALWLFSAFNLIFSLWNFEINRYNIMWFASPLVYCVALEFMQMIHFTDGTFDIFDLIFYFVATLFFMWINRQKIDFMRINKPLPIMHLKSAFSTLTLLIIVIFSDYF